jgi:hypothetical protein
MLEDGQHPLFLQAKEAGPSVLEAFVGDSEYDNRGQRVVVGQRLMQAVGDVFLGWVRVEGLDGQQRDFYIRQLRDWKGSVEVEAMVPDGMRVYGELCGWTLARAHARSGDRIALAAYLGGSPAFDVAVREFAEAYADQNERDHQSLLDAIGSGRITAEAGEQASRSQSGERGVKGNVSTLPFSTIMADPAAISCQSPGSSTRGSETTARDSAEKCANRSSAG